MIITADNFVSWQMAAWLAVAGTVVALTWRMTKRVDASWLQVFYRAAVVALCFMPLPHILAFAEQATLSHGVIITPFWYVLFCSIVSGDLVGICLVLILWLIAAYFLWVVGMVFCPASKATIKATHVSDR